MNAATNHTDNRELTTLLAALLDDTLTDEQFQQLDCRLSQDASARQLYLDYVQLHDELPDLVVQRADEVAAFPTGDSPQDVTRGAATAAELTRPVRHRWRWMGVATALGLLAALALLRGPQSDSSQLADDPRDGGSQPPPARPEQDVRFASVAQARFFGELPPAVNTTPIWQRNYVLLSGMVEVAFPRGASAIIAGPAVFRIDSAESLALDVGHCSVHAPPGAEGFRVETPTTHVVDRGTRFAVCVGETNETEVQVIEGAADVYRRAADDARRVSATDVPEEADFHVRLTTREAQRFDQVGDFSSRSIPFNAQVYQRQLPDRVISYEATSTADGGVRDLLSVSVQRGGKVVTVPVEQMIPSEVIWFRSEKAYGCIAGDETLPSLRVATASDRRLMTGVINPGGSPQPLTSDPVMEPGNRGTPGMAVRFERPVLNGPGADVVLFDLQTFINPADGDAFHVSPLAFAEGLHSHTIRTYDLTMESPQSREVGTFHVHMFEQAPRSLAQLQTVACASVRQAIRFRALAVGIDLSELGYEPGASVEGLFLQDAEDDEHRIDPVYIGGFPALDWKSATRAVYSREWQQPESK